MLFHCHGCALVKGNKLDPYNYLLCGNKFSCLHIHVWRAGALQTYNKYSVPTKYARWLRIRCHATRTTSSSLHTHTHTHTFFMHILSNVECARSLSHVKLAHSFRSWRCHYRFWELPAPATKSVATRETRNWISSMQATSRRILSKERNEYAKIKYTTRTNGITANVRKWIIYQFGIQILYFFRRSALGAACCHSDDAVDTRKQDEWKKDGKSKEGDARNLAKFQNELYFSEWESFSHFSSSRCGVRRWMRKVQQL